MEAQKKDFMVQAATFTKQPRAHSEAQRHDFTGQVKAFVEQLRAHSEEQRQDFEGQAEAVTEQLRARSEEQGQLCVHIDAQGHDFKAQVEVVTEQLCAHVASQVQHVANVVPIGSFVHETVLRSGLQADDRQDRFGVSIQDHRRLITTHCQDSLARIAALDAVALDRGVS